MRNANFDFQPKGFTPYKRRTLAYGQEVKVYRNLHKKCYSVVDYATGLVLGYVESITLTDAEFTVRESGRQRVLQEKRKNVHAHVVGIFAAINGAKQECVAYYNPYKVATFVNADTQEPVHQAAIVTLDSDGITYS